MLEIIDTLKPFFEDCYRRINVREFARIQKISPPTASKILKNLENERILKRESDKQYLYYYANKDSALFIDLSRIYWRLKLNSVKILDFIEENFLSPVVILFGSLSKAETKKDSDVDLAIFSYSKKKIDFTEFEKKLKRKIQVFIFKSLDDIKNKDLLNNILNGYKLKGNF